MGGADSSRPGLAADAGGPDGAAGTVVVQATPGPKESPGRIHRSDELDDLVEETFGPTTTERPGTFDAGLVVAGVALLASSLVGGGSGLGLAVGVALFVVGAALPARSLILAANLRRGRRRDGG